VRVLVTGGAGFIGSHVADRLTAEGREPVVLDALIPQAHGGEKPPWVGELLHADVRDPDALREALRGIDAVCHQAAMVGHGVDASDAPAYAAHNDLGTAVLLAAMYEAGVSRLVLAGSMVVYGEGRYRCGDHGVVRPGPRTPADVAAGRFEGFWEESLHAWDMAAGALLVEEAGGRVSRYNDEALDIFGRQLIASNGRVHAAMVEAIQRVHRPV
jgi:dTDP-L-rhamnose 4-epimerase